MFILRCFMGAHKRAQTCKKAEANNPQRKNTWLIRQEMKGYMKSSNMYTC